MKQSRAIDCSLSRGFALLAGIPEKDTAEKPVDKNYKGVCFLNGVLRQLIGRSKFNEGEGIICFSL